MSSPYDIIKIDKYTRKIQQPNLLLMNRSGKIIGKIGKYDNWNISLVGNGMDEIKFKVQKYYDGKKCPIWDDLIDLKIVEVNKFGRFEISVEYTDRTETVKSIHGISLETELAQIPLYEFHVNDDEATSVEITEFNKSDFNKGKFIPTVFYNEKDKEHSLLHRVLADKAPHWSIGIVTPYISLSEESQPEESSKFQRTYTVDGDSIYDFLTGTVAQESNVIFVFDTIHRIINCYSLCDCIDQETGNVWASSIGMDTTIFASKTKLANEITISSNKNGVKNCFRIEGGDDVITDMVRAVNMNGSNYINVFSNLQYDDMSQELSTRLKDYQYDYSAQEEKYIGENGIYPRLCKKYEELSYYESEMMPAVDIKETTAEEQYNEIVKQLDISNEGHMTVGVSSTNYTNDLFIGVTNNVEAIAQILIDSRYNVSVIEDSTSYDSIKKHWKGNFLVKRSTDETDYFPKTSEDINKKIEIAIDDSELLFARQKIEKALSKGSMLDIDFDIAKMTDKEIHDYFDLYSLNRLKSFYDGYNSCISILTTMGMSTTGLDTDSPVRVEIYDIYKHRLDIVEEVYTKRKLQVEKINHELSSIKKEQSDFQEQWNFKKYLGDELYKEYCSYRREDTYRNDNYISDGLSTSECLTKAKELIEAATQEAKKACVLQRTISTSLNNLFALPEFEPLYDKFSLFNYIRIRTEDEILKLRIIGIEFDGNSIDQIQVTFSDQIESIDGSIDDTASILKQAENMSSSYSSTVLQAKKGEDAKNIVSDIYNTGLNAAKAMITNSDNNEITITQSGIICRRMDDEGYYGEKQIRIIGNMIVFTKNNWQSVELAIGETTFLDPEGNSKQAYGIIAENIVGKFLVSEHAYIGNEDGSVEITGNGIVIKKGTISWDNVNSPKIDNIDGLQQSLTSIKGSLNQIDGRIQTYSQPENPKDPDESPETSWSDEDDERHKGDVWINTETGIVSVFTKVGSIYDWVETQDENLKALAQSKAQIFTNKSATITEGYKIGDLWILENDDVISGYKKGTILVAKENAGADNIFTEDHWRKATVKDASDALQDVQDISNDSKVTPSEKQSLRLTWFNIISEYASITALANKYNVEYINYKNTYESLNSYLENLLNVNYLNKTSDIIKKDFDEYFNNYYSMRDLIQKSIDTASKKYVDDSINDVSKDISDFKSKVNHAFMGDSTTSIGSDYVISPKIAAKYLYVTNDNYSVEIDPRHGSSNTLNNYLFCIREKNSNSPIMSVNTSGNGYFKGEIEALKGKIGGWNINENILSSSGSRGTINIDANKNSISTISSSRKVVLESGSLTLYDNDYSMCKIHSTEWRDTNIKGSGIWCNESGKFLVLGHDYKSGDGSYTADIIINNGLNLNGKTVPVQILSDTYLRENLYFTDTYYLTGTSSSIYCNTNLGTAGNVYIGNINYGHKLNVDGTGFINGDLYCNAPISGGMVHTVVDNGYHKGALVVNGDYFGIWDFKYGNWMIHINKNGEVTTATTLSDKRLKSNIKKSSVNNALEQILAINHREFIFNQNNKYHDIGYIAQELESINPLMVIHPDNEKDFYYVDSFYLEAIITKAIQEFHKEYSDTIANLNIRIKELENKLL